MASYVILGSWTQQGIQNAKDSPQRLEQARQAFQSAGGEIKEFFLVTGRYDFVIVAEAPDDTVIAKIALKIGSGGSVRTETLRAFNEEEYRDIIASLG